MSDQQGNYKRVSIDNGQSFTLIVDGKKVAEGMVQFDGEISLYVKHRNNSILWGDVHQ